MTPKTIFGFTFKTNNVSKSAHISNVFKKSLGMLKSERIPNVLKFQRIYAIKGLDLKSVPIYLFHRLMGQAQPPMMVVRPQAEDIKIQLAHSEKVKHLQTFTQIEEAEKINHLAPYPLMDRASPQIEEKVYPQIEVGGYPPMVEKSFISWNCSSPIEGWTFTPMTEAPFTPLGETSVHKTIANLRRCHYPNRALSKILKLALVGYKFSNGVHSASSGFFVRNISMRSHIVMAKLWRDTLECAGDRLSLSTNPFQLCHPYLVVIGKAPTSNGVHNCA